MKTKTVWTIKDKFHPFINGENEPIVRSDNPAFEGNIDEFIRWCKQHGALSELQELQEP